MSKKRNYIIEWVSTATGESGATMITVTPDEFGDHLLAFSDIAVVSSVRAVDRTAITVAEAFEAASGYERGNDPCSTCGHARFIHRPGPGYLCAGSRNLAIFTGGTQRVNCDCRGFRNA